MWENLTTDGAEWKFLKIYYRDTLQSVLTENHFFPYLSGSNSKSFILYRTANFNSLQTFHNYHCYHHGNVRQCKLSTNLFDFLVLSSAKMFTKSLEDWPTSSEFTWPFSGNHSSMVNVSSQRELMETYKD